jgi:hypothetical protein
MTHAEELVDKRTTVTTENQVIRELRAYMQPDKHRTDKLESCSKRLRPPEATDREAETPHKRTQSRDRRGRARIHRQGEWYIAKSSRGLRDEQASCAGNL